MQVPIVKSQYHTADNPIFVVFYLENAHAVITDFSGKPPKEYNFLLNKSEVGFTIGDEDVLAVSKRLIAKNKKAYKVLAR